jgi:hypothetical protein
MSRRDWWVEAPMRRGDSAGWPWRIAPPGLPTIRACPTRAPGSSCHLVATRWKRERHTGGALLQRKLAFARGVARRPPMRGALSSEAGRILLHGPPAHPPRLRLRSIWPISDLSADEWSCNPQRRALRRQGAHRMRRRGSPVGHCRGLLVSQANGLRRGTGALRVFVARFALPVPRITIGRQNRPSESKRVFDSSASALRSSSW